MNLLDYSVWIEYFGNGPNADRFATAVADTASLLVRNIVLHEVYRWAEREGGDLAANRAVVAMQAGVVGRLNADRAISSARLARRNKLPTADRIIYATAMARGAIVWTQADDFADLPARGPILREDQI
jgi:predicted nucleic acid-binding protein